MNTLGPIVPFFRGPFFGASALAAGLILAVMILPTISAISRDVLLAVPRSQREAALALGSTEWETIWQVVLPYGLSGILGAVILGLGRALGETMAVTMVIGNVAQLTTSLLSPGYTMASVIANEWGESRTELYSSALIEIGLLLFIMSLLLNIIARFLVWSVARKTPEQRA
jgi:phosphate transport system permease protein